LERNGFPSKNEAIPKPLLPFSLSLLFLLILIWFIPFEAVALDKGGADFFIENRTTSTESPSLGRETDYETNYHFDFFQDFPGYGRLSSFWDIITSNEEERVGRGLLKWEDFKLKDSTLSGSFGDSSFSFTAITDRFLNSYYPDVCLRGANLSLLSRRLESSLFSGRVATLSGLLGKTYDLSGESLHGLKIAYRPKECLTLGGGFIRTVHEEDPAGERVSDANSILMLQSELNLSETINLIGEYKASFPEGTEDEKSDYALRVGPIIRGKNFHLEGNFYRIGSNYRFVSEGTQVEKDREGGFLTLDFSPDPSYSLFGTLNRYRDNLKDDPERNIVDTTSGFCGISFHPKNLFHLYSRLGIDDRDSRRSEPSRERNRRYSSYSEISRSFSFINPYFRYRFERYEDRVDPTSEYNVNSGTSGFRFPLKKGRLYLEAEHSRKDFEKKREEETTAGKIGFSYHHSQDLSLWGEVSLEDYQDKEASFQHDRWGINMGMDANLPLGLRCHLYLRMGRIETENRMDMKADNYQVTFRIEKRFGWGRERIRAGAIPGVESSGIGSSYGFVFNDLNGNRLKDLKEEGIEGVKIRLEDGSSAISDKEGRYEFSDVEAGSHYLSLEERKIPAGYNLVSPTRIEVKVERRKAARQDFLFISSGEISGRVLNDQNGDGGADPGEKGISDVLVYIGAGEINTYTDEEGRYHFYNLSPASYTVTVDTATLPEGFEFTSEERKEVKPKPGERIKGVDFLIHVRPRPVIKKVF
jgi:hypothetical protein